MELKGIVIFYEADRILEPNQNKINDNKCLQNITPQRKNPYEH